MRIIVVGSVNSSLLTLKKLCEYDLVPVAVFGFQADDVSHISGYEDLEPFANANSIAFHPFRRINDHYDELRQYNADLIFVVGLSQLVSKKIIELPTFGCVGFHPTALPLGRGRAPIAWIILDNCPAAATYFRIAEGVDDGPIYTQVAFDVNSSDDALSITNKILTSSEVALDQWLPELVNGKVTCVEQNHTIATYYGKRIDDDGQLVWSEPAVVLERLVRATTHPYPGAFSYMQGLKIRIWNVNFVESTSISDIGSIVNVGSNGGFTVQTGGGFLKVLKYEVEGGVWEPLVGMSFDSVTQLG